MAFAMCLPMLWTSQSSERLPIHDSSKKSKTMVIEKEIIIEKNISQAWQVLGPQFADAYKWASAVHHSEGTGAGLNGSSCSERGCSTTMGALRERLLNYAPGTYELEYEVA